MTIIQYHFLRNKFSLKSLFMIIFFAALSLISNAQSPFTYWDSIPVIQYGDTLKYPFAGGFNDPEFSTIDMNGDNIEDLFVFERSTNKVYTFINTGVAGQPSYIYEPQYRTLFPPELTGWVLMRDYNCDGKKDIFTSRNNSFAVYRNDYSVSTGLKFTLVKTVDQNFCYIISADIPSISDIDNDGDLDILTFDPSGVYMRYFKNLSVDSGWHCDSLVFTLDKECWGSFTEDFFSCSLTIGDTLSPCRLHERIIPGTVNSGSLHPGNTTLALDLNGDGKKEVIIGPQVCSNVTMLTNSSLPVLDSMIQQNNYYPDMTNAIHFSLFPATYYEDVNNDGRKDLIGAPNRNASEDTACAWVFLDTSSSAVPKFAFQKKNFLQGDMIDVGEGANPVFFDYNGDSLMDLVIGNYGYYSSLTTILSPGQLALYENVGTKQSPAFKLITRDFANLSSLNLNGLYPAFGDLDGDGDEDMILGESTGKLFYFTNTAGKGNSAHFVLTASQFDSIDVGQFATPQLVDVNLDCKLDLLVGERGGTILYFENTGTDSVPKFSKTPTITQFGGIDVTPLCCTGYAVPFLTTDNAGHRELLVGTESDSIYLYTNIDNNLNGIFQLSDAEYAGINEGSQATICGADLNNDGMMDLVVGNYAGGVTLFKGQQKRVAANCNIKVITPPALPLNIYAYHPGPIPRDGSLAIHITGLNATDNAAITIYNLLGQKVYYNLLEAVANDWQITIPVLNYATGVYFLKVSIPSRTNLSDYSLKFMVGN